MTEFVLNMSMTECVLLIFLFDLNIYGFILNITEFVIDIIGFVIKITGLLNLNLKFNFRSFGND